MGSWQVGSEAKARCQATGPGGYRKPPTQAGTSAERGRLRGEEPSSLLNFEINYPSTENLKNTLLSWLTRHSPARRWLVPGLLGGLLAVGLLLVRDYGMSYDAGQSRVIGLTSLRYVAERIKPDFLTQPSQRTQFEAAKTPLPEFVDRDYGVGYELPVTLLERGLGLTDTRAIYLLRHLCTFLVCWLGVLALYGLGRRRYDDWRLGLAAAGLLVLSPRLFGEFFYNDKDAVFMALSTVATLSTVRFVERPTAGRAAVHALACALALNVRLMAVLWPLATLALLAWRGAWGEYRGQPALAPRRLAAALALYGLALPALTVALWPYLWAAPWTNFQQAFDNMQHFRWNGTVLYRGEMVSSVHLPWHYAPTWLALTTPLPQLTLIGLGLSVVGRQLLRRGWRLYAAGSREWQDLLFLGLGLGPLVAIIVFKSTLYDGWRQLYFVYPSLLLLGLRGLTAAWGWLRERPRWQGRLVGGALGLALLSAAGQLVWLHPFQSLYFNALAGPDVSRRYEQDYWGISYGAGLRWVLAHDERPQLRIYTEPYMWTPMQLNYELLPAELRTRIKLAGVPEDADYFLTTYRYHPGPYDQPAEASTVQAGRRRVLSIFRLRW